MRSNDLFAQHVDLTRRYFLQLGAAASAVALLGSGNAAADDPARNEALAKAIAELEYFTPADRFGTVERGTPLPYTHPIEKLREVGMTRETWKLEVVPDADSKAVVESPLSKEAGTALDFDELMKLAEKHAVRFLKIMTCNNGGSPLGMGVWEGVPLRDVVWMAKPKENVRRAWYYGYHNDDEKQMFRSSLPIGRILEDPPGLNPVILCYKLNGELLTGKRGGPVRMVVPEAYGFKSVKWLQKVVLTNEPFANDTYANGNNDVDSWMKTFARFAAYPAKAKAGEPIPITGACQVGISGLSKVQYWLHPKGTELPADDPNFTKAPWKEAEILSPPATWKTLPEGISLGGVRGFDDSARPKEWPMRFSVAHWAALITDVAPGQYELRCRTIDANGHAQPMPRPFAKSGRNNIQSVAIEVVAT